MPAFVAEGVDSDQIRLVYSRSCCSSGCPLHKARSPQRNRIELKVKVEIRRILFLRASCHLKTSLSRRLPASRVAKHWSGRRSIGKSAGLVPLRIDEKRRRAGSPTTKSPS